MTSVLAVLWLATAPPGNGFAETPAAPPAASATEEAPAQSPEPHDAAGSDAKPGPVAPPQPPPPAGDVVEEGAPPLPTATTPARPVPRRQSPAILAQDPRMTAYGEFRRLYETANFEQALPYAQRVVELSEQDPDRDRELPIAYNNLGATQYHLGQYTAAAESYKSSLELLETTQGISSRRLVVPLAGLGAVFAALDQHEVAAELLDRALAVSRRAEGLFNLAQLPLIEQVADSRYAIEDYAAVEQERMYAVKIAEQNFGYGDERTLSPILDLARFYESLREFVAARMMYLRARDVAYKKDGPFNPLAVKSLVGIARTHRMQYTMDPDTLPSQQPARDEITGEIVGKVWKESRVPPPAADRTGLKSAQTALELLRKESEPPEELLSETLIELGDWYQSTSRPSLALPYYQEAATILEAEQASDPLLGNPLLAPRIVFYRPPVSASRGLNTLSGQYIIRKATFSFEVTEDGRPQNIAVVTSDMSEAQLSQSRRALSRAIYSPRFVEGRAVATGDVSFTSEWYEQHDPPPKPPSTQVSSSGAVTQE